MLQGALQDTQEASYCTDTTDSWRWTEYVCWSVSMFLHGTVIFTSFMTYRAVVM